MEFQQVKFPLLPWNHYKFSLNLSGHVADLDGFWSGTIVTLLASQTDLSKIDIYNHEIKVKMDTYSRFAP